MNNFKSHVNSRVKFDKGIVAIIGENGSGKSSIFEAVFFALFGAGSNFNYDTIITKGKKFVYVELDFEVNGNNYKIVREYDSGKGRAKLYKNGKPYATTISAVNKAVNEILGVDRNMFLNSIYIKQGEIAKFLTLKPSERMETVAKLLGIDDFEKCYQKMGEVIREYEKRLGKIEGELNYKENYEKDLKDKINQLNEKNKELVEINNKLDKIKKEFEDIEKEFNEWENKKLLYEKLTNKLEERKRALELKNQELKNLKYDLNIVIEAKKVLEKYKDEYEKYKSLINEIKEIEDRLKELKIHYEDYLKLSKQLEVIKKDIEKIKEFVNKSKYKNDIDNLDILLNKIKEETERVETIKDLLEKLKNLNEELEKIEKYKKICEECKEYHEKYLKLEKDAEEYDRLNLEYVQLLQEKKSIEKNINDLKTEINKLLDEIKNIDIESIEKSLKEIEEKKKLLENLQKEKIELNKKLGEINSEIKRLKKILDELKEVEGKCPLCKTPIDENKKIELINQHKTQLNNKYAELEEISKKIKKIEKDMENLKREINEEEKLKAIKTLYCEKQRQIKELELKLKDYKEQLDEINKKISKYIINGKPVNEILENIKIQLNNLKSFYNQYISAVSYLNSVDEEDIRNKIKEIENIVSGWDKEKCREELNRLREEERDINRLRDKLNELKIKEKEFIKIKNMMSLKFDKYREYLNLTEKLNELKNIKNELEEIYNTCNSKVLAIDNIKKKYNREDIELFLSNKILEVNKEIKDIEEKISYINQKLDEINYNEEEHGKIKKLYENKGKELEEIKKQKTEIETGIEYLEEDIKNIRVKLENLSNLEKEKEKLMKFVEYLDKIRKIFGRNGFQSYLREKYVPLIQKYLNEAFSEFDLPYSFVELTKDFEVKVHAPNGVLTIDNLSGGEQIAVALSLRLAIANALIGNKVECIILDEPTVYLDENRRAKLAEIFRKVKSIPQMIIITHHRELEDVADVIINVKKDGNVSKVKISQ